MMMVSLLLLLLACTAPAEPTGTDTGAQETDTSSDTAPVTDTGVMEPVDVTKVVIGFDFGCALDGEGKAYCWGVNTYGQASPPIDARFTRIDAGSIYACGHTLEGTLICWGETDWLPDPLPTVRSSNFSTGAQHLCVLDDAGTPTCWGNNEHGQAAAPTGSFVGISAGGILTCAWDAAGAVTCWGWDNPDWGLLNPPDLPFANLSVGFAHACGLAVDSGRTHCWGQNLMDETRAPSTNFVQVASGTLATCARTTRDGVVCWGNNDMVPPRNGVFTDISMDGYFGCGVTPAHKVSCWGDNEYGQTDVPAYLR